MKFKRGHFEAPKPKKDGSGSTIQFDYSMDKHCVYMTMAKQLSSTSIDNARFDYENKIVFKLGPLDLIEFMKVFSGKQKKIRDGKGLFHQFTSGDNRITSSIHCDKNDPKYGGYFVKASKSDTSVGVKVTDEEAMILNILFRESIINAYGWNDSLIGGELQ